MTLIRLTATDCWKLSLCYLLFSRLQGEHNAELLITANVYAGIMTKQLLRKVALFQQPFDNVTLNGKSKEDSDYIEEVSDVSEN